MTPPKVRPQNLILVFLSLSVYFILINRIELRQTRTIDPTFTKCLSKSERQPSY